MPQQTLYQEKAGAAELRLPSMADIPTPRLSGSDGIMQGVARALGGIANIGARLHADYQEAKVDDNIMKARAELTHWQNEYMATHKGVDAANAHADFEAKAREITEKYTGAFAKAGGNDSRWFRFGHRLEQGLFQAVMPFMETGAHHQERGMREYTESVGKRVIDEHMKLASSIERPWSREAQEQLEADFQTRVLPAIQRMNPGQDIGAIATRIRKDAWDQMFAQSMSRGRQMKDTQDIRNGFFGTGGTGGGGSAALGKEFGSLSAKYESAGKIDAVGRLKTDGTAIGPRQIASRPGGVKSLLAWTEAQGKPGYAAWAARLKGLDDDALAREYPKLAREQPDLTKEIMDGYTVGHCYEVARRDAGKLDPKLLAFIDGSPVMREIFFSTMIQHGHNHTRDGRGAPDIFNKVFRKTGPDAEAFIREVYRERGTRFKSSTPEVRASILRRFERESADALAMLRNGVPGAETEDGDWISSYQKERNSKWDRRKGTPEEDARLKELFLKDERLAAWVNAIAGETGRAPETVVENALDDPDYDYRTAIAAGIRPEAYEHDGGMPHWPTRTQDGKLLKSARHPTLWMDHFMRQHGFDPHEKGLDTYEKAVAWTTTRGTSNSGGGRIVGAGGGTSGAGGSGTGMADAMPLRNPVWTAEQVLEKQRMLDSLDRELEAKRKQEAARLADQYRDARLEGLKRGDFAPAADIVRAVMDLDYDRGVELRKNLDASMAVEGIMKTVWNLPHLEATEELKRRVDALGDRHNQTDIEEAKRWGIGRLQEKETMRKATVTGILEESKDAIALALNGSTAQLADVIDRAVKAGALEREIEGNRAMLEYASILHSGAYDTEGGRIRIEPLIGKERRMLEAVDRAEKLGPAMKEHVRENIRQYIKARKKRLEEDPAAYVQEEMPKDMLESMAQLPLKQRILLMLAAQRRATEGTDIKPKLLAGEMAGRMRNDYDSTPEVGPKTKIDWLIAYRKELGELFPDFMKELKMPAPLTLVAGAITPDMPLEMRRLLVTAASLKPTDTPTTDPSQKSANVMEKNNSGFIRALRGGVGKMGTKEAWEMFAQWNRVATSLAAMEQQNILDDYFHADSGDDYVLVVPRNRIESWFWTVKRDASSLKNDFIENELANIRRFRKADFDRDRVARGEKPYTPGEWSLFIQNEQMRVKEAYSSAFWMSNEDGSGIYLYTPTLGKVQGTDLSIERLDRYSRSLWQVAGDNMQEIMKGLAGE